MKPRPPGVGAPQVDAPLNDEWFAPSQRSGVHDAPVAPRRGLTFTLVSVALVGFALGGCLFLWTSGSLPRWTGTAPAEVGTTRVTNAPLTPVPPMSAVVTDEPKSTAVDLLPSAPAAAVPTTPTPTGATPATPAPRALAPKVAPAAPRTTPAPASTESSPPAAAPAATMAPTVDPDPAPTTQ